MLRLEVELIDIVAFSLKDNMFVLPASLERND